MIKNCRQRLFYRCEEPVVAVSSQSSRGCIYSTRLAHLVISVTVLQPAILSNSSVGHSQHISADSLPSSVVHCPSPRSDHCSRHKKCSDLFPGKVLEID